VTIERGRTWGEPGTLPVDGVVVRSDAEARAAVEAGRRAGDPLPVLGLLGGDLCRTVGGGDERRLHEGGMRLPCDLGSVLLDGRQFWFVAHLVARRSWWRGRLLAAMNAEFVGGWDVAPRGHPNDGRLDLLVVDPAFSLADRWKARGRLATGAHVPHPLVKERRVTAFQEELRPPLRVWLDGVAMGEVHTMSVRVEPDALTVVV
jgi:hypothetical protein